MALGGGISESITVHLKGSAKGVIETTKEAHKATTKAASAMKKSWSGIASVVKTATKTIALLTAGVGALFTTALIQSAKAETAFSNLTTLFTESKEELEGYRVAIDELSLSLGKSAVETADAFYQSVSAGMRDLDTAKQVVEASTKAAVAGSTETAVAVEAITRVMNAYGEAAGDATHVSDLLFQTVNYGVTTFEKLAPSIGMVAGTAAQAGVKLEELMALVATLTKYFPTEQTITSIQAMIMAFLKPSDAAIEKAREFGVELNTAGIKAQGFVNQLKMLSTAGPEAIAEIFPRAQSIRGVLAAISNNASELTSNLKIMGDAAGSTDNAFGKMTDTVSYKWGKLWNTVMLYAKQFGDIFREDVKDLLDWIQSKTPEIAKWVEGFKKGYENLKKDIEEGKYGKTVQDIAQNLATQMEKYWVIELKPRFVQGLKDVIAAVVPVITPIAISLGKTIGSAIIEGIVFALKDLPQIMDQALIWSQAPEEWQDFIQGIKKHFGFQEGGSVPGDYFNQPRTAVVHAGEFVVNPHAAERNRELLEAINRGDTTYHDVGTYNFSFADKFSYEMVLDKIVPALAQAKRTGFGLFEREW